MVSVLFQDYPVAFLTLWHFQSVQECKACKGIIPEKCWLTPPHFLHFLHFGGRKCRKWRKCKWISSFFLFTAPYSLGLGQPYIYTPALNQTKIRKWWPLKKKNPPMSVGESVKMPKCQECQGVNATASHSWLSRGSGLRPASSCQLHGGISPSLLCSNAPWGRRQSWCSHRWRAGWRQTSVGCNAMRFSSVSLPRQPISSTAGCSSHKGRFWISARWSGHWSSVRRPTQAYHRWAGLSPSCGCWCCGLYFAGNGASLSSDQHWRMSRVSRHTSGCRWKDRSWTHVAFRCSHPCIGEPSASLSRWGLISPLRKSFYPIW